MSYIISKVDAEKARESILHTWTENFPDLPEQRFGWIYRDNPAGPAISWLALKDEDGDVVVGAAALLRRSFHVNGTQCGAAISADFAVVPGHRGFGPALAFQREAIAAVNNGEVAFAYGLPNPQALPLLRRVGFKTIGSVQQWTQPLRSRSLLERRLGGPSASVLAPFADAGMLALRLLRATRRRRGYHGEDIGRFDGRFDSLFNAVREEHVLIGDRSANFLSWRFGSSPHADHRIFGLADKRSGELAAYIVYHRSGTRVIIDDLLCRDSAGTLDTLLLTFASRQHRTGAETIAVTFFGSSLVSRALKRNGFSLRDDASDPFVAYAPADSEIEDTIMAQENWWFFLADNDI